MQSYISTLDLLRGATQPSRRAHRPGRGARGPPRPPAAARVRDQARPERVPPTTSPAPLRAQACLRATKNHGEWRPRPRRATRQEVVSLRNALGQRGRKGALRSRPFGASPAASVVGRRGEAVAARTQPRRGRRAERADPGAAHVAL